MSQKRLKQLDLLKTIAIFMVVFHHISTYDIDFLQQDKLLPVIRYLALPILSVCIPIFFVINGYFLFQKHLELKKHLLKTIRLVFLTLFWAVVISVFTMIIRNDYLTWLQWIKVIFYWREDWNINILWYLAILVSIYLIFPILKCVYDYQFRYFVYFTLLIGLSTIGNTSAIYVFNLVRFLTIGGHNIVTYELASLFNPFRDMYYFAFFYFCLGGLLYRYENQLKKWVTNRKKWFALILLLLSSTLFGGLGIVFSQHTGNIWNVLWFNMDSITNLCNVCCFFVLTANYHKDWKIIHHIGQNTLGIYLIHMILIELTKSRLAQLAFFDSYLGTGLYTVGIITLCLILIYIIQKIPYLRKILSIS